MGDLVTLYSWRLSRQPPSERYPYGYGKFEVLGTTVVSILLTGGALGIGLHSWSLLADTLSAATATMGPGPLHDILTRVFDVAQAVPAVASEHAHIHAHTHALQPFLSTSNPLAHPHKLVDAFPAPKLCLLALDDLLPPGSHARARSRARHDRPAQRSPQLQRRALGVS